MSFALPAIFVGDLSCIACPEEKRGGGAPFNVDSEITYFLNLFTLTGLIDLGYKGSSFTWCNNQHGVARLWERLDRASASES